MTSAESSDKTPGEEPLLKAVEAVWKHYPKNNAFDGYGAVNVDLEGDNNKPIHMTVEEAKADVIAKGYVGFTYATGTRQMWRLKSVGSPSGFAYANWADVYVLEQGPNASGIPTVDESSGCWCRCRRRRATGQNDADASERKKARVYTWTHHAGRNAYDGNGAVNVDLARDDNKPIYKTVEKAKADAISNGYAGFTYEPATGRMWRLKTIVDPWSFKYARWADVYILDEQPGAAD